MSSKLNSNVVDDDKDVFADADEDTLTIGMNDFTMDTNVISNHLNRQSFQMNALTKRQKTIEIPSWWSPSLSWKMRTELWKLVEEKLFQSEIAMSTDKNIMKISDISPYIKIVT